MEVIGDNIDRLITVEVKKAKSRMRGKLHLLYEAAREKAGGKPLSFVAASRIMESVRKNDNVVIITGIGSLPFFPHGETDGPLGAAAVARVACFGLQATPIFVVGERDVEPVVHTARAAGLNVEDYDIAKPTENAGAIIRFPYEDEEAKQSAKEIIEKYSPKALISVETLGPNRKGIIHTAHGLDLTAGLPKLHYLFDEARKKGILTIGCLDNGNEIGSGLIEETIRKVTPYGNMCQCPCKSGNACATEADIAIPVATSNWGAYGISAMLAFMLKDQSLLHDSDTERRMLEACVMAGGVDGQSLRTTLVVDGMSVKTNQGIIDILHMIVENGLFEGAASRLWKPVNYMVR